jgi:hypothetical protein
MIPIHPPSLATKIREYPNFVRLNPLQLVSLGMRSKTQSLAIFVSVIIGCAIAGLTIKFVAGRIEKSRAQAQLARDKENQRLMQPSQRAERTRSQMCQ